MKCLYFVQYFPPEKASGLDLVEDLIEGFAHHGWDVELFTPTPTRGIDEATRQVYKARRIEKKCNGKISIHRMRLYREGSTFLARTIRYLLFSIECLWKAVTVPADFIFTGSGPPTQGLMLGMAKKLSKKKAIYNLQDIFPDSLITAGLSNENSLLVKIGRLMETFTYNNSDHIITVSNDMERNLIQKGVEKSKISVIHNWIDTGKIIHIKRNINLLFDELNLQRNKFYVVYAGNLGKVQGIDNLLHAAALMKGKTDVNFLIFGNGSEENKVQEEIKANDLFNIALYPLQAQNRISEVYSMGNVCIVSCRPGTGKSGMPSKTWAIMATGTPIIASFDIDSEMKKTIDEAQCGICVEPGNPLALADAICKIYQNPTLAQKMGENARQYVMEHASKSVAVSRYIEQIEKEINS